LKQVACLVAGTIIVIAPWTIRNYMQFGKPILGTTHGGKTFLWGNNPWFYEHLRHSPWGRVWDADELHQRVSLPAGEVQADERCYQIAFETIRNQPDMFAYSCLVRLGRLWSPLPHQLSDAESWQRRVLRYGVAIWYSALFLLAAIGCWSIGGRLLSDPWIWAVLLCLSFSIVHTFYWSNMRMRAPLMPAVCLIAAVGAMRLRSAIAGRK
jgi:hypothetical protein